MILATKLFVPQLRPGLVPRPALVERVRIGLQRPLTLVAAPAGFGKTTLLTQALAQAKQIRNGRQEAQQALFTVAWLALDPEDNAPLRFWRYVAATLDRAVPGLAAAAQASLHAVPPPEGQDLAATLINAATELPADQQVVLVLDDYHLITSPAIQQQLTFLLDHLPLQLRVAILTRADPPLALPRRRARGEVSEIRATDLRFNPAEIASFFRHTTGVTLEPHVVAALDQRTEGWIASLQLAALALEAEPAGGAERLAGLLAAERNLLDYLADEVLAGLDPPLQAFLLRTAILDRLNAALCATILELPEAAAADRLHQIETAGLFLIALDAGGHWYRYHHLFAQLLRIRLQRELPALQLAALHLRASTWHAEYGDVDAAVRHALDANTPAAAAAAIETRYPEAVRRVDGAALASWLAPLPGGLVATRPRLILADAWRALLQLDVPTLERYLPWLTAPPPDLESALRAEAALLAGRYHLFAQQATLAQVSAQAALAELPSEALFLRGMALLNLGLAQRNAGDLAAAETALADAAQLGRAAADSATFVTALIAQANVRMVQGNLAGAEQLLRQVVAQVAGAVGATLPLAELALISLGWLLVEQDRLDEAIGWLEDGLALARRRRAQRGLLDGSTFLALAYAMRGDRAAALRSLAEARTMAERAGPGVVGTIVAERTARMYLLLGEPTAAHAWALRIDPHQQPDELAEDVLLTYVRAKLAEAEATANRRPLHAALEVLARLQATAEASRRVDRCVRVLVLSAVAYAAQDDQPAAQASLQSALTLAAPDSFIRTFVNAGMPLRRLLEAQRSRMGPSDAEATALHAFTERLLEAFGAAASPAAPGDLLAEPLTEREQEVLLLIAAGYSNAAIAEQLMVAVTTVKAHLRNIFGKLEVGSRTQAVARARELGLMDREG